LFKCAIWLLVGKMAGRVFILWSDIWADQKILACELHGNGRPCEDKVGTSIHVMLVGIVLPCTGQTALCFLWSNYIAFQKPYTTL